MHAVLMDVLGLGVLIVGESGIGKSECALDLIVRGHRLVADDTVEVRRRQETILIGTCPELTRHHMELRGLGVINVKELFGIASTRSSKRVELVVQLERWDADARVRAARPRRRVLRDPRAAGAAASGCRWRPDATSRSWSRSRRAISCCGSAATTPRASSPARLDAVAARAGAADADADEEDDRDRVGRRRDERQAKPRAVRNRAAPATGAAPSGKRRQAARGSAVHRAHRPVGLGQVAGDPRARGSRLLLRRQPADDADSDAGEAVAARRRRHREGRDRRRRPRGRTSSRQFPKIFQQLRKMPRLNPVLIFLEASHAALVRRFSETRRPHPLAPDRSVSEGIRDERAAAEPDPRDWPTRSSTPRT